MEYVKHLYQDDTEGYIQVMSLKEGKVLKIRNTPYKGIREIVEECEGKSDTYITPNTFYIPTRGTDNIRHFRSLYIDLDIPEEYKTETVFKAYLLADQGIIPKPSMTVDSGRGIHLYWKIEHAPKGAAYTWQALEDYLYHKLKPLGADIKATDGARILRLPGTINSKNGEPCKVLHADDSISYDMRELREKYLGYKSKPPQKKNSYDVTPIKREDITSYSLHQARAEDIQKLTKLRGGKMEGCRNTVMHCFVYWRGIYTREPERLEAEARELNNRFKKPLPESELRAILRSVPKAINKFIEYEQGLNIGMNKRVSKGMRDKGGYWYKNDTLIERLSITEEEQKHLKTIISKAEKYRRRNDKRNKALRNENGLTPRQQKRSDTLKAIKDLKDKGFTRKEIAGTLEMTIDGLKYYLYRS